VVAENVDERRVEAVGQERELFEVEVATANDEINRAHGAAVAFVLEGGVELVRDRQEPDRGAASVAEGRFVGPFDREMAGHRDGPCGSAGPAARSGSSDEACSE
jgi:hypothetical protein